MIAIVDIDGVIADSTERFNRATVDGKINWDQALNGRYVHLDDIIPGALEAMIELDSRCSKIYLLTSRPWHMDDSTIAWLDAFGIQYQYLISKPEEKKYTKTVIWKGQEVVKIAQNNPGEDLIIVDDEQGNLMEIEAHMLRAGMHDRCEVHASLEDALA